MERRERIPTTEWSKQQWRTPGQRGNAGTRMGCSGRVRSGETDRGGRERERGSGRVWVGSGEKRAGNIRRASESGRGWGGGGTFRETSWSSPPPVSSPLRSASPRHPCHAAATLALPLRVCVSVCLCVCVSVCLCLAVCLSACLYVCVSVCLAIVVLALSPGFLPPSFPCSLVPSLLSPSLLLLLLSLSLSPSLPLSQSPPFPLPRSSSTSPPSSLSGCTPRPAANGYRPSRAQPLGGPDLRGLGLQRRLLLRPLLRQRRLLRLLLPPATPRVSDRHT
eukprot:395231-Rhodomonas_salina.1